VFIFTYVNIYVYIHVYIYIHTYIYIYYYVYPVNPVESAVPVAAPVGNKDCNDNIDFKAEADQLQEMISSMNSFLGGKSGTFDIYVYVLLYKCIYIYMYTYIKNRDTALNRKE
jgi:hypothetical protein